MQREEFERLTNIHPTQSMYHVIEKAYMASEKSKEEFCRAYALNIGGVAEEIQRFADILEVNQQQGFENRIAELQEQLDKELEWNYFIEVGTYLDQEEYLELCEECDIVSDETAVKILSITFGLIPEKIRIRHEVQEFECNKYGDCRAKRTFQRKPVYENIERNYIRFDCAGRQLELVNSDLLTYDEPEKNEKGEKDVMG